MSQRGLKKRVRNKRRRQRQAFAALPLDEQRRIVECVGKILHDTEWALFYGDTKLCSRS